MPEFMFDPSTGTASEVIRGHQQQENPDVPTIEQIEDHQLNQRAENYSRRQHNNANIGDSDDLVAEQMLLEIQQNLTHETNPLKIEQMQREAEAIAAGLVGANDGPQQQQQQEPESFEEELLNQRPGVQDDIAYAAEVMGEELITSFNEDLIESDDELVKATAYQVLSDLRENTDSFVAKENASALDSSHEAALTDLLGSETTNDIMVLSEMVRTNRISSTEAIATAAKSPRLMQGLRTAAQQGIIKIAL